MTTEYEFAAENGHRVRVDVEAEDPDGAQAEAFEKAIEQDPDIWMGGAYPAVDEGGQRLPVGWDGGDAEEAIALGESIDHGDIR